MESSRASALLLLERLLSGGRAAPHGDDSGGAGPGRDARFAAELAHGTIRMLTRVDRALERAAGRPLARIAPELVPVLRLGAYQLLFMPSVPRYAAVSESVELARGRSAKAAGFVNWVLRRVDRDAGAPPTAEEIPDPAERLAATHSFPPWIARRWLDRLGEPEAARAMEAMNVHPPPHVRVNPLRATPAAVAASLSDAGFETAAGRHAPSALHVRGAGRLTVTPPFERGEIYLQDESSQLAARVLAPRAGERVLDACAGVGGKSTQLAEIAGDRAVVAALDRDPRRIRVLEANARRLGLEGIRPRCADLLDPSALLGEGPFDAVLLDAPCSGIGTIPRHPELKWSKRPGDPARLARTQRRMLERAASLLAPGGRLLYSVCTTEPEECEDLVLGFLEGNPGFAISPPPPGCLAGLDELLTPRGLVRTWPHRHGIGGAFAALLRKG